MSFLRAEYAAKPPDAELGKLEEYLRNQERPWWFQTAKEVRESDELKIKDYKEDIDTLLVFSALFSAVITAFIIESYKGLQPDTGEISVQILLHMSQQLNSFAANGQFFNSTIPAFTLPTFIPFKPYIVTNAVWFASLMVSLMAASYGMLVKQWLREYLANRDASPIARLRIRCFRYPALSKWKVFEIVAALPLLLQSALGLFFVGLCYFASTIHPVVEWTVIPLVAIWAFLFVAVTLAPILSSSCPYKTTFLKDVMVRLRRTRYVVLQEVTRCFSYVPPEPEEEDTIAGKDNDDFEVLAQVDFTQADDGLISPALIDLGREHPGPALISFVFSILTHRNSLIMQDQISSWRNMEHLSVPLLRSVSQALSEALRNEHSRTIAAHTVAGLYRWDPWVQTSTLFLITMSTNTWFLPSFRQSISKCLSIAHSDCIDSLHKSIVNSADWSEGQKEIFVKNIVSLIDPSAMNTNDFRPLILHNIPDGVWTQALPIFGRMIFPENTASQAEPSSLRNPDTVFAFRVLFGESQKSLAEDFYGKLRTSFEVDQIVGHILSPILDADMQGSGRVVAAYTFRLLRVFEPTEAFELSYLSDQSRRHVHNLLAHALKDELNLRSRSSAHSSTPWDAIFLRAICVIISSGAGSIGIDAVTQCFTSYPEVIANGIIEQLSRISAPILPAILPILFRTFLPRINWSFDTEPWSSMVEPPTDTSVRDILVNVTARCLAHELGKTNTGNDSNVSLWFKWGIHLLLSCFESKTEFSDSTIVATTKLISQNPHFITHSIPLEEDERQIDRLWRILNILDPPKRISFITPLWPRSFVHGEVRIPFKLLQMHADGINKNVVEVFLQDTPQDFHTRVRTVKDFIFSFRGHCRRTNGSMERWLDELQPFIKTEEADDAMSQIVHLITLIKDPRWPVWMKEYLTKHIQSFQGTSEIPETLKECLCENATEGIALIAEHGVEYLDKLPDDLLTFRKSIRMELRYMFRTFVKHPEPLDPEQAEKCLMRLIVHAEVDRLMWTFCTHAYFADTGNPPPRYACVSFLTRILKYYLDPKGVSIAQKDIRSPLDLTQLEKEVWDDASSAAAEILNRTKYYKEYFYSEGILYPGGEKLSNIAHMDVIMILLATSPHPFSTDLCYKVLEQDSFFRWEDNHAIQPDVQRDLEERRQRRREEGRKLRFMLSTIFEDVDYRYKGGYIGARDDNDEEEWETNREEESDCGATHGSESQLRSQQQSPDSDGEQEGREQGRSSSSMVEVDPGTHTDVLTADNEGNGRSGRRSVEQEEYMQDDLPEGDGAEGGYASG